MKILVFTSQFCQLGGAERLDVDLARGLNRAGIHADVLSMYTEDFAGAREVKTELLADGIPNVFFLGMRLGESPLALPRAARRLRRLIQREAYDIVQTSLVAPGLIAAWGSVATKARHVAGLHQVFTREVDRSLPMQAWRLTATANPRIRYYAISHAVSRSWLDFSGVSPSRVRVVYNSIRDEFFTALGDPDWVRAKFGLPRDARLAVYVGRIAKYKGIETIIDALRPIADAENLCVLLVGSPDLHVSGTPEMMKQLRARMEEPWASRLRLIEFTPDVARIMASADVLVHPTQTEGFGLVITEAMAAGLPVVASDVDAIPEVVQGTASIMVPPRDADALRRAVLEVLGRTAEERATAAALGRRRANDFRSSSRVEALKALFTELCPNK